MKMPPQIETRVSFEDDLFRYGHLFYDSVKRSADLEIGTVYL